MRACPVWASVGVAIGMGRTSSAVAQALVIALVMVLAGRTTAPETRPSRRQMLWSRQGPCSALVGPCSGSVAIAAEH